MAGKRLRGKGQKINLDVFIAVGKNPIGYLIPCHRVIRSSGEFGNYRWGKLRKNAILIWENSQKINRE